jgi:hypothetical protein
MHVKNQIAFAALFSLMLACLSCSKSDMDEPSGVPVPKLVRQVKTTESIAGVSDISTQVFEYNDRYQIVKRYLKEDVNSYESYAYDGDIVNSIRQYRNNALVGEYKNPVVVEGNRMTIITTSAPYADGWVDSVFLHYSFQGELLSEYGTVVRERNSRREFRYQYTYDQGILSGVVYSSILDGQASVNNPRLVVRSTDTHNNPYVNASRMNRMLFAISQIFIAHGSRNVLAYETGGIVADITHEYDAEGYPVKTTYLNGGTTTVREYTYTR